MKIVVIPEDIDEHLQPCKELVSAALKRLGHEVFNRQELGYFPGPDLVIICLSSRCPDLLRWACNLHGGAHRADVSRHPALFVREPYPDVASAYNRVRGEVLTTDPDECLQRALEETVALRPF